MYENKEWDNGSDDQKYVYIAIIKIKQKIKEAKGKIYVDMRV